MNRLSCHRPFAFAWTLPTAFAIIFIAAFDVQLVGGGITCNIFNPGCWINGAIPCASVRCAGIASLPSSASGQCSNNQNAGSFSGTANFGANWNQCTSTTIQGFTSCTMIPKTCLVIVLYSDDSCANQCGTTASQACGLSNIGTKCPN